MAFMVKQGLYHLSNVAIHNDIINCVTSDLKPQVVKLNGVPVTSTVEFDELLARLQAHKFLGEKIQPHQITVKEVKDPN